MEGNAFAADGQSQAKKRRLEDISAAPAPRCAQDDTALEVDVMILDYLLYSATAVLLDHRSLAVEPSDPPLHHITMVDSFLTIFRARRPTYKADAHLHSRLRLLKLVTMYTQRLVSNDSTPPPSALKELRQQNQERAKSWIGSEVRMPSFAYDARPLEISLSFPPANLSPHCSRTLASLGVSPRVQTSHYGSRQALNLLDILPTFMGVVGGLPSLRDAVSNPRLLHLLGEFMLQACLEQYLALGEAGADAIDEAFAWGYKFVAHDTNLDRDLTPEEDEVNALFEDEECSGEHRLWTDLHSSHLAALFASAPGCAAQHFERLSARHPIDAFEAKILDFLSDLTKALPEPVLVQLENGQLLGMDQAETAAFVKSCGLEVDSFYRSPAGFHGAKGIR